MNLILITLILIILTMIYYYRYNQNFIRSYTSKCVTLIRSIPLTLEWSLYLVRNITFNGRSGSAMNRPSTSTWHSLVPVIHWTEYHELTSVWGTNIQSEATATLQQSSPCCFLDARFCRQEMPPRDAQWRSWASN
jgi:hypothetical protein